MLLAQVSKVSAVNIDADMINARIEEIAQEYDYTDEFVRYKMGNLNVQIKRILRRHGYPPDKQARATELVLEQAEVLCHGWTTESKSGESPGTN